MTKSKTVLLVDDDIDDQEIFLQTIREIDDSLQYEVAENGIEALEKLTARTFIPDLIFLDINMPGMDGFSFLSHLKKESSFAQVPVIIFTTSKNMKDKEKAMKFGADHFLTKPHVPSALLQELKILLTEYRML